MRVRFFYLPQYKSSIFLYRKRTFIQVSCMKELGKKILELREQGKSYNKIVSELKCSKSTVSYYCGDGQKEKSKKRINKNKKNDYSKYSLTKKITNFKNKKVKSVKKKKTTDDVALKFKIYDFKRNTGGTNKRKKICEEDNFYYNDIIKLYEDKQFCYLSGRKIDLKDPTTFELDHIIPLTKNGTNKIGNLGLAYPYANRAKNDLTVDEFIELCKDVLEHNGYKVIKEKNEL